MAWWGWLLGAWVVVALMLAVGMGAAARTIKREERAANTVQRLSPLAESMPDASPGMVAPQRTRLSGALRAGPRR